MVRLDKVANRQSVRLTHYGGKIGRPYEVTIWFVVDGERIYVGTANVNRHWVRSVQQTPKVGLSIGGEKFEGQARFLTDGEHEHAQAKIRKKYWMFWQILALGQLLIGTGAIQDKTGSSRLR